MYDSNVSVDISLSPITTCTSDIEKPVPQRNPRNLKLHLKHLTKKLIATFFYVCYESSYYMG